MGTSATCLERADCLGESIASLRLIAYAACCVNPLQGGSAVYLGRVVDCLGNSTVCLGLGPWLGTSSVSWEELLALIVWGEVLTTWEKLLTAWEAVLSTRDWVPGWKPALFTWEDLLINGILALTACGEALTAWGELLPVWEELALAAGRRLLPAWGELTLAA